MSASRHFDATPASLRILDHRSIFICATLGLHGVVDREFSAIIEAHRSAIVLLQIVKKGLQIERPAHRKW
jgi:hypothetical protein